MYMYMCMDTHMWFIAHTQVHRVCVLHTTTMHSCSVFIGVSERQETETNIRQLKVKKKNEQDLENYRKWIQTSRKQTSTVCTCMYSCIHGKSCA